jgi:hypothetical protein
MIRLGVTVILKRQSRRTDKSTESIRNQLGFRFEEMGEGGVGLLCSWVRYY